MWARGPTATYVADLFSAAFVRWNFADSFDTMHAHPDPLQLQTPDKFFSSMPFPSLQEYSATLCVFNPYETASAGRILVHSADGRKQVEQSYKLTPYASALFNLNSGALSTDLRNLFNRGTNVPDEIKMGDRLLLRTMKRP